MDIFLTSMRSYGLKFSELNFLQSSLCGIKRTTAVFLISLFSLVLVSCGGGNGPSDEGENSSISQNSAKQNLYSAATGESILSRSALPTKGAISTTPVGWCQAANTLLCENFEWSSSLAYQATEQDWQLKGWQFSGNERSGNNCNSAGVDDSQCALKWAQVNDRAFNTLQSARYVFSASASTYNKLLLNWAVKWSANWLWNDVLNPHVSLEMTNADSTPTAFISLAFDPAGFVEVTIAEDKNCGRNKRVIKSAKAIAINNNSGQWHGFQLAVAVNDSYRTGNIGSVQLSLNNEVVLRASDVDLGGCTSGVSVNTVSFISTSFNSKLNTEQTVQIDNILLTM